MFFHRKCVFPYLFWASWCSKTACYIRIGQSYSWPWSWSYKWWRAWVRSLGRWFHCLAFPQVGFHPRDHLHLHESRSDSREWECGEAQLVESKISSPIARWTNWPKVDQGVREHLERTTDEIKALLIYFPHLIEISFQLVCSLGALRMIDVNGKSWKASPEVQDEPNSSRANEESFFAITILNFTSEFMFKDSCGSSFKWDIRI